MAKRPEVNPRQSMNTLILVGIGILNAVMLFCIIMLALKMPVEADTSKDSGPTTTELLVKIEGLQEQLNKANDLTMSLGADIQRVQQLIDGMGTQLNSVAEKYADIQPAHGTSKYVYSDEEPQNDQTPAAIPVPDATAATPPPVQEKTDAKKPEESNAGKPPAAGAVKKAGKEKGTRP
jgi:hypothetical protein